MTSILTSPIDSFYLKSESASKSSLKYASLMMNDGGEQNYCELPNAFRYIDAENKINSIQSERRNFEYKIQLEKFRSQQITDCQEISSELRLLLGQVQTTTNKLDTNSFNEKITILLENLTRILNRDSNNISPLAGGGEKATCDLTTLPAIPPENGNNITYDYYKGVFSDTSQPINATHAGFEKLIRSCRLCLSADLSLIPHDPSLEQAIRLCEETTLHDLPNALVLSASHTQNLEKTSAALSQEEITYAEELKVYGLEATLRFLELHEEQNAILEMSRSITLQMLSDLKRFSEMHF